MPKMTNYSTDDILDENDCVIRDVSPAEAAMVFGVGMDTVYEWMRKDVLTHYKIGRSRRIRRGSINAIRDSNMPGQEIIAAVSKDFRSKPKSNKAA